MTTRAEVERGRRVEAVAHRIEVVEHHEGEGDEQAGDEAGDEQRADRDVGDRARDDDQDRGRNDRREHRGAERQADGVALREAVPLHRLDLDRPDRGDVGDRRARHAAEDDRRDDVDMADPAGQPADEASAKSKSFSATRPRSIRTPTRMNSGTATSRNEFIAENMLCASRSIGVEVKATSTADAGEAERDGERNAKRTQEQEDDEKGDAHQFILSLSGTLTSASRNRRRESGWLRGARSDRVASAATRRSQGWRGSRKAA